MGCGAKPREVAAVSVSEWDLGLLVAMDRALSRCIGLVEGDAAADALLHVKQRFNAVVGQLVNEGSRGAGFADPGGRQPGPGAQLPGGVSGAKPREVKRPGSSVRGGVEISPCRATSRGFRCGFQGQGENSGFRPGQDKRHHP